MQERAQLAVELVIMGEPLSIVWTFSPAFV